MYCLQICSKVLLTDARTLLERCYVQRLVRLMLSMLGCHQRDTYLCRRDLVIINSLRINVVILEIYEINTLSLPL